jgi:hypothetical protein
MSQQAGTKNSIGIPLLESINRQLLNDPHRLVRVGIVSSVFALSILLGFFVPFEYLVFPLILIAGSAGIFIYLRYPPIGLLALLFVALLISFEVGTGTGTGVNLVVALIPLLLGVWVVDMVVRKRKFSFVVSRPIYPLIALAFVSLLAFGVGQLPWFAYAKGAPLKSQVAGLAIFLLSVAAFMLVANLIHELRWLKRLTWFFLFLGLIYMIVGSIPALSSVLIDYLPRGGGGSLLYVWLVAMASSQLLINRKVIWYLLSLLMALLALTFYVAIVLQFDWKSGWVPSIVVLWVVVFLRSPKIGIMFAIFSLIFLGDIPDLLIASDEYSYNTRLAAWEIIWMEIIKVNPLLGLGPANYYFYTPLYPILGYSVQFNSHNNYVDIIAQIGLLGLACLLWFVVEMVILGWGLLKKVEEDFSRAYVIGVLAGLGGTLVAGMLGDWVFPFVYNVGVRGIHASILGWIFMGGLVVIQQIHSKKNSKIQVGN